MTEANCVVRKVEVWLTEKREFALPWREAGPPNHLPHNAGDALRAADPDAHPPRVQAAGPGDGPRYFSSSHSFIVIGWRLIGHFLNPTRTGNPFASPLSFDPDAHPLKMQEAGPSDGRRYAYAPKPGRQAVGLLSRITSDLPLPLSSTTVARHPRALTTVLPSPLPLCVPHVTPEPQPLFYRLQGLGVTADPGTCR